MGLGSILRAFVNYLCAPSAPPPEPQRPTAPHPHPLQNDIYAPLVVPHRPPPQASQQYYQPSYPVAQPQVPPSHRPSAPASPPHRPTLPSHQNLDLHNQHNEHYQSLRARAKEEGAQMARCFEESHTAYARGEGARAKELSNEGKTHQREMERLNAQASEWIFVENNKDSKPGEVDLHGLYVKEAITYTDRAIQEARQKGDSKLHLIVGKGLHSPNGIAKLRPAIEDLMRKHGLVAELDQSNGGVLIVNLDGIPSGEGSILRPDDISRRLESKEDGCLIM
ncbi:hypothetical protein AcW1_009191 [Taiwanofungus camphoratus]|nr:hypothetical protein AcW1_009191 [Antrodia cinnamomea]